MRLNGRFLVFKATLLLTCAPVHAGKFDAYFGGYNFSAKTNTQTGSKSGVGAYKVSYVIPLLKNLEAGIGFSVLFSNVITGDAAYGLDLELYYYPLTMSRRVDLSTEFATIGIESVWRPFVLGGYSARQFQSTSTQYFGLTAGAGTEYAWTSAYSLKGMIRYNMLTGPNEATASEMTVLGGVSFSF